MKPTRRIVKYIAACLFSCLPYSVSALSTDSEQPLDLASDHVKIDDKTGISVYTGNVHVNQGTLRITANKVTVYMTQKRELEKIVSDGNPATFRQLPDGEKEYHKAKSLRMEYFADRNEILLLKKAKFWQGKSLFQSERILYDIAKATINAGENNTQTAANNQSITLNSKEKPRVHVIIEPQKKRTNSAKPR